VGTVVLLQCLGRCRCVADDVIVGFGPAPDDIGQDLLVVIVVVGPRYPAADNSGLRIERRSIDQLDGAGRSTEPSAWISSPRRRSRRATDRFAPRQRCRIAPRAADRAGLTESRAWLPQISISASSRRFTPLTTRRNTIASGVQPRRQGRMCLLVNRLLAQASPG
jgi:hypothetical protein